MLRNLTAGRRISGGEDAIYGRKQSFSLGSCRRGKSFKIFDQANVGEELFSVFMKVQEGPSAAVEISPCIFLETFALPKRPQERLKAIECRAACMLHGEIEFGIGRIGKSTTVAATVTDSILPVTSGSPSVKTVPGFANRRSVWASATAQRRNGE